MAALPQLLYFAVERVDGAAEAAGRARWRVEHHRHGGTQDAGISAVVAQGGLESKGGPKPPTEAKPPAKAKKKQSKSRAKPRNRAIPVAPVWLPEFGPACSGERRCSDNGLL